MQPVVQCVQSRARTCLTRLASHLGQSAPHLCFDRIQFSNAPESMQGLGAALLLGNIVELASNMGPASRFFDPTTVVQGVEPGIPIGLNDALEVFKVTLGMFTRSEERRVGKAGGSTGRSR